LSCRFVGAAEDIVVFVVVVAAVVVVVVVVDDYSITMRTFSSGWITAEFLKCSTTTTMVSFVFEPSDKGFDKLCTNFAVIALLGQ
jgi:hypothetical protein